MFYLLLGSYVASTAAGLILIKLGSAQHAIVEFASGRLTFHPTTLNIVGLLLYGISFVLYTYLISKNELGFIIPLTTALVYILIFIASFVVFNESFTLQKILAITLILVGVILLSIKK